MQAHKHAFKIKRNKQTNKQKNPSNSKTKVRKTFHVFSILFSQNLIRISVFNLHLSLLPTVNSSENVFAYPAASINSVPWSECCVNHRLESWMTFAIFRKKIYTEELIINSLRKDLCYFRGFPKSRNCQAQSCLDI